MVTSFKRYIFSSLFEFNPNPRGCYVSATNDKNDLPEQRLR